MNDASLVIRSEAADDHDAIRRVVSAAFGSDAEADLVERIRASPEYVPELALVAVIGDGAIVGHVMVSGTALRHEAGERTIAMLSPLAVHPGHQSGGIGGALVRAVTALADAHGEPVVILEGSPAYYSRFGFESAAAHGIEIPLPDWAPAEAAQVLPLSTYDPADATLRGRVTYPTAFDGIG